MTSQSASGDTNAASIAQEVAELVAALRQDGADQAQEPLYRLFVETLAGQVTAALDRDESYAAARQVILALQHVAGQLQSALTDLLAGLERLERARQRRERYSPRWWEAIELDLQRAFDTEPQTAFQQWLSLYAQALVDWELETCGRLAAAAFAFPRDQFPYVLLVRHGDRSIQEQDYAPALPMLNYLAGRLSEANAEDQRLLAALLSIFVGRIHLSQLEEPDEARQAFERAAGWAPRDGRPLAAQGHLALAQGESGWAEANRLFSRAVEFSPDQPEGHVGKAMLAEARRQWSEADAWYQDAIQATLDEPDLLQFSSKLLAPGSGRLYQQIARHLLGSGVLDRALAAIEHSLELGLDDDTSYPTRGALALKADILAARSGPSRSAEDAKTIADLYFQAGKYYTWTDEFQTAVELLKKGRDLDSQNALLHFYLADDLRVLSHSSAPPYYASREIVCESLAAWQAGLAVSGPIDADTAWVYVARSRIEKQLARLPDEDNEQHYWQAILFDEQALLLRDEPRWWSYLSNSYDGLSLYANMLHVLPKAEQADPDDLTALEERAKVLLNTGQLEPAQAALTKLLQHEKVAAADKALYQSWQAMLDYYRGDYAQALENARPMLEKVPDDLWIVSLRANVNLAQGDFPEALKDVQWIWDQRDNPKHKSSTFDFAWAAFWLGQFKESVERITPSLASASVDEQNNARVLASLNYLALDDFKAADELLLQAMDTANRRALIDMIKDLEQLAARGAREGWTNGEALITHLNRPKGILPLARAKLKKTKAFAADPVRELNAVLSNPLTGKAGAWSWLAAHAGLGRLHLEAGRLDLARQAYQALAQYPEQAPEAKAGLKKVEDRRKARHKN